MVSWLVPVASTPSPPRRQRAPRQRILLAPWQLALLIGAVMVFMISAGALLGPQVADTVQRWAASPPPVSAGPPAPSLSEAQVETVLSYASTMQPDDGLVEVRPGVFAKRSNVSGVQVDGHTVYYDILSHQSFGPLRSGKVSESQIDMLARESSGSFLIVVYTIKGQ
ncbi:MAG: hypothetical protein ACRDI2_15410 [Chloroflexota bacterium]